MTSAPEVQSRARQIAAWLCFGMAGAAGPALAMLLLAGTGGGEALTQATGPVLAIALMGAGMIGAAITARLWIGIALALGSGVALILLASALGVAALGQPPVIGTAVVVASLSFAARGALFARSSGARGWMIAVAVVAGEAAVVATAAVQPDALPDGLLALLPAQWATTALTTALTSAGPFAAAPVLLALGGTAGTTLLVAALWPRRWPYLLMFSAWIGLSALVYHAPVVGGEDLATAIATATAAAP